MKQIFVLSLWTLFAMLPAQAQTPAQAQKDAPPPGIVHFYRERLEIGALTRPMISCDQFPLARITNGRIYTIRMSPGRHAIGTSGNPTGILVDIESGREYYLRIDFEANAANARNDRPVLVPLDQGRTETMKLKPLDGKYIEAATCGK